ncbi:GNAT family N-acetyltransferase [Alkalibacterium sp. 20]|uniref:GNAT family N-acetyltransferase n=1 Tax=Alkalibacterium sp. 20 TaxID=1798803 RepID=UPI00090016CF|nr:GNAT family N-acetyltransferase [Alkalibacterium sp. 20]
MIELKPVTKHNYMTVVDLNVHPHQKDYVASNGLSLLEANYESDKYPFAIYNNGDIVGFIMCSYYAADDAYPIDSWWLERFMIDKDSQGNGIGRQALSLFLNEFRPDEQVDELRLGVEPENDRAIKLYESFGFVKEGVVEGEIVYFRKW